MATAHAGSRSLGLTGRLVLAAAAVALAATACTADQPSPQARTSPTDSPAPWAAGGSPSASGASLASGASAGEVTVRQQQGKTVYWVLPGKRRLSPEVFGTASEPERTGAEQIEEATGSVKDLLQKLPLLVGIPPEARETTPAGDQVTKKPVPVGKKGKIVDGSFTVTYADRQPYDLPDAPFTTTDAVQATASFTDPQGNRYELVVDRLFQPPIPDWQTGGGVLTGAWIHGTTGTDSPLFPTSFTHGAFWGVGDVKVNGEVVDRNKWIHFMTTQIGRDESYQLATDEELPLARNDTIAGKLHHTHVIVRPIRISDDGTMTFEPVNTAHRLPNGKKQPYLHLMFEEERITQGPFGNWTPPAELAGQGEPSPTPGPSPVQGPVLDVAADEFTFDPGTIEAPAGTPITLTLKNSGELAHNLTIASLDVETPTIQPGETATVTISPQQAGELTFFCSVPGHRDAGMEGHIRLSE